MYDMSVGTREAGMNRDRGKETRRWTEWVLRGGQGADASLFCILLSAVRDGAGSVGESMGSCGCVHLITVKYFLRVRLRRASAGAIPCT
jgi:hypothetical protein